MRKYPGEGNVQVPSVTTAVSVVSWLWVKLALLFAVAFCLVDENYAVSQYLNSGQCPALRGRGVVLAKRQCI